MAYYTILTFILVIVSTTSTQSNQSSPGDPNKLSKEKSTNLLIDDNTNLEKLEKIYGQNGGFPPLNFKDISINNLNEKPMTNSQWYFGTHNISEITVKIFNRLDDLNRDELGSKAMQSTYDTASYNTESLDPAEEILNLENDLTIKFEHYSSLVKSSKKDIMNLFASHLHNSITPRFDCCNLAEDHLKEDKIYGCKITKSTSCDLIPPSLSRDKFNPGRNLTGMFQNQHKYWPSIKWLYFITSNGLHTEFPAHNFRSQTRPCDTIHNMRHRDVFLRSIMPDPMWVVIVLDQGKMTHTEFQLGKRVARTLISSLSEKDRIALLILSDKVSIPFFKPPDTPSKSGTNKIHQPICNDSWILYPANPETRYVLLDFLTSDEMMKPKIVNTSHLAGIRTAFKVIQNTLKITPPDQIYPNNTLIAYISPGNINVLNETSIAVFAAQKLKNQTNIRVVINTYMLTDKQTQPLFNKRFMRDLAESKPVSGAMLHVHRNVDNLDAAVTSFYQSLDPNKGKWIGHTTNVRREKDVEIQQYTLPYQDLDGSGLVLSISQAFYYDGYIVGVFGLDIHMAVLNMIKYYKRKNIAYAFMVHKDGYSIMHPSLSHPINAKLIPMHTDIIHLEKYSDFHNIRQRILNEPHGNASLFLPANYENANANVTINKSRMITYYWRKVGPNTPFIVVIKAVREQPSMEKIMDDQVAQVKELHYHRIDVFKDKNSCLYFNQLSNFDFSTVFIAARAFTNPFQFLNYDEDKEDIQRLLAYLTDLTQMITHRKLPQTVRSDVAIVGIMNKFWLTQYEKSSEKHKIIRRYVATSSGVFRVYPGTLLPKSFDPNTREWYRRALQFPNQIVFTGPYLDAAGAGHIVTMSYTLFEGGTSGKENIVAVIAADFSYRYFYQIIQQLHPPCNHENITCFIMEDKGYIVAHPDFLKPQFTGPSESNHITHLEPLIADDLLNNREYVHKTLCNSYNDRTVQRVYLFNMTSKEIFTNIKLQANPHARISTPLPCTKYQMVRISGTNSFFGIINSTKNENCGPRTSFCPCSRVSRDCLNCQRMEQSECECPCECPLRMELCSRRLIKKEENNNPWCLSPRAQDAELNLRSLTISLYTGKLCGPESSCSSHTTKEECFNHVGCEWCEVRTINRVNTRVTHPYCDRQSSCYGGVIGAESPYRRAMKYQQVTIARSLNNMRQSATEVPPDGVEEPPSTPVGPVTGGVMASIILISLAIYCYRHRALRLAMERQTYQHGVHDNHAGFEELLEDPSDDASLVLAQFESNPAGISPYRVTTGYQRPTGTHSTTTGGRDVGAGTDIASSIDQGYSSTVGGASGGPHGVDTDQEGASTVLSEPPVNMAARSVVSEPDSAVGSSVAGSEFQPPRYLPPPVDGDSGQGRPSGFTVVSHHPLINYPFKNHQQQLQDVKEIFIDEIYDNSAPVSACNSMTRKNYNPVQTSLSGKSHTHFYGQQMAVPVQIHAPPSSTSPPGNTNGSVATIEDHITTYVA